MKNKNNLEHELKCAWRIMAEDGLSTTFEDVREHQTNHSLWKCKYNCGGFEFDCSGYRKFNSDLACVVYPQKEKTFGQEIDETFELLHERARNGQHNYNAYAELFATRRKYEKW